MSEASDHDLLLRLISKFDAFYDEFRRVSNGTGFPRCAERLAYMKALEEDLKTLKADLEALKAKLWWVVGLVITSFMGFIVLAIKEGLSK